MLAAVLGVVAWGKGARPVRRGAGGGARGRRPDWSGSTRSATRSIASRRRSRSSPRCSCSPRSPATQGCSAPRAPGWAAGRTSRPARARRCRRSRSLVTVLMSLDATAVLFTPVVVELVHGPAEPLRSAAARDHAARQRVVEPAAGVEPHQPARVLGHRSHFRRLRGAHGPAHAGGVVGRRRHRGAERRDAPTPRRSIPRARSGSTRFAWFVVAADRGDCWSRSSSGSALGIAPAWIASLAAPRSWPPSPSPARGAPRTRCSGPRAPEFLLFVVALAVVVRPRSTTGSATPPATCSPPATACSRCWPWPRSPRCSPTW